MSITLVVSFDPPLVLNKNFPYERLDKIINEANIVDRYFDSKLTKDLFLFYSKNVYSPILSKSIELKEASIKSGIPYRIAIVPTGVFFELSKYDNSLLSMIKKLQSTDALDLVGTTFYDSVAPLFTNSTDEVEEQIKAHLEIYNKLLNHHPTILSVPHLFYNDKLAKVAQRLGFKAMLTEEMAGFNDYRYTYLPSGLDNMKVFIRNRRLSEAMLNGNLEELRENGVGVVYLEGEGLAKKGANYSSLILESIYRSGNQMVGLDSLLESKESGILTVPEQLTIFDGKYGDSVGDWAVNKFQRAAMDRLYYIKQYLYELGDQRNIAVWRLLQQAVNILEMDRRSGDQPSNFVDADDAKLAFWSIYMDFEGKVASKLQTTRKTKQLLTNKYSNQKMV